MCLEATSGRTIWKQELAGGFGEGFVSLALSPDRVFAHTRGKLWCLDRGAGTVLWMSALEGLGFGFAFVCTDSSPAHYVDALLKKEQMRSSGS